MSENVGKLEGNSETPNEIRKRIRKKYKRSRASHEDSNEEVEEEMKSNDLVPQSQARENDKISCRDKVAALEKSNETAWDDWKVDEDMFFDEDISDDEDEGDGLLPRICFTEEENAQMRKPWNKAIIVKLLGRTLGYQALSSRIKQHWQIGGRYKAYSALEYYSTMALLKMGSCIGRVVRADRNTEETIWGKFACLAIKLILVHLEVRLCRLIGLKQNRLKTSNSSHPENQFGPWMMVQQKNRRSGKGEDVAKRKSKKQDDLPVNFTSKEKVHGGSNEVEDVVSSTLGVTKGGVIEDNRKAKGKAKIREGTIMNCSGKSTKESCVSIK